MTTFSEVAPSARRRRRVVRGCLAGIAVGGTLWLAVILTTFVVNGLLDRTYYRVLAEAKDRADVVQITAGRFQEERRDIPRGYTDYWLADRPGWTCYIYSMVLGSDDYGFYVIYDEREKIVDVLPTYE